jgi:hypothetical protein
MDWIMGSMLGTALVVLVLYAIKIIGMKREIKSLHGLMEVVIRDRTHFGYYDADLRRVELWSQGKEAVWEAVKERMVSELRVGRVFMPYTGFTEGFPVAKVLLKLLDYHNLRIEGVLSDSFELKKVKKK